MIGISNTTLLGRKGWLKFALVASGQTNDRLSVSNSFAEFNNSDELEESKISGSASFSYLLNASSLRVLGGGHVDPAVF